MHTTIETRHAAHEAIKPCAATLRESVLTAIIEHGMTGLTDEQGIVWTGMNPSTYRPRRGELVERGLIVDMGERRKTASGRMATVWFAAKWMNP